jgi:pyruvate dehydrogenase E2 component (dihydrolipoamide acetyltransferase)
MTFTKNAMPIEITVPRLGWSMEQGTFVGWLIKDGEAVRAGEALFTLDGDKAIQEIEAMESGILRIPPDAPKPGATVAVGQLLGYLLAEPEVRAGSGGASARLITAADRSAATGPGLGQTTPPPPPLEARPPGASVPAALRQETVRPPGTGRTRNHPISPRALRTARRLGVDWSRLKGSGRSGRIRERDVLAAKAAFP